MPKHSWSWWITTIGGLLISACAVLSQSQDLPEEVRGLCGALVVILGAVLGISHPGRVR